MLPSLLAALPLALADVVPDPDTVTPGVVGFVATALVAIATILLLLDMNRRVRRAKILAEVRADIAQEQAAAAAAPGADGADAAVDADALADDAAADQLLGERAQRGGQLAFAAFEVRAELLEHDGLDAVELGAPLGLVGDGERLVELRARRRLDGGERVVLVVGEARVVGLGLGGDGRQFGLGADELGEGDLVVVGR